MTLKVAIIVVMSFHSPPHSFCDTHHDDCWKDLPDCFRWVCCVCICVIVSERVHLVSITSLSSYLLIIMHMHMFLCYVCVYCVVGAVCWLLCCFSVIVGWCVCVRLSVVCCCVCVVCCLLLGLCCVLFVVSRLLIGVALPLSLSRSLVRSRALSLYPLVSRLSLLSFSVSSFSNQDT